MGLWAASGITMVTAEKGSFDGRGELAVKVKVKFICIAHFMYKTTVAEKHIYRFTVKKN